MPLRSQASMRLDRSLLDAGLVDAIELTVFPVLTGVTGTTPVFAGVGDHRLELVDSRALDGRSLALTYRPVLRT